MASREAAGLDEFTTGATRSSGEEKIDYEGHLNPEVLAIFGEYMHRHRRQRNGELRASDNWQLGIPAHRYVSSLVRHGIEFWRMWRGTPVRNPDSGKDFTIGEVLCAIIFNAMGLLYEINQWEMGLQSTHVEPEMRQAFKEEVS